MNKKKYFIILFNKSSNANFCPTKISQIFINDSRVAWTRHQQPLFIITPAFYYESKSTP